MPDLDNLVFISGPQGAGKTTLIDHIVSAIPHSISPNLKTKTPQFYWGGDEHILKNNYFHRQALKYAQRAIENYEYLAFAKKNPEKIVIGDRCILDGEVYRAAGILLGWLTNEEDREIEDKLSILFPKELLNPKVIILNPGFEVCKAHLEKRWKETGWIKYRETEMNYLMAVCESFRNFQARANVLYLGERIDYSEQEKLRLLMGKIELFIGSASSLARVR